MAIAGSSANTLRRLLPPGTAYTTKDGEGGPLLQRRAIFPVSRCEFGPESGCDKLDAELLAGLRPVTMNEVLRSGAFLSCQLQFYHLKGRIVAAADQ
jgi:hypothetical protein